MSWVEMITVRSTSSGSQSLSSALRELMNDVAGEAGRERIRIYKHERIETDFCIVLFHEESTHHSKESPLGLRLAAALKEFGLVNNGAWIEMH